MSFTCINSKEAELGPGRTIAAIFDRNLNPGSCAARIYEFQLNHFHYVRYLQFVRNRQVPSREGQNCVFCDDNDSRGPTRRHDIRQLSDK